MHSTGTESHSKSRLLFICIKHHLLNNYIGKVCSFSAKKRRFPNEAFIIISIHLNQTSTLTTDSSRMRQLHGTCIHILQSGLEIMSFLQKLNTAMSTTEVNATTVSHFKSSNRKMTCKMTHSHCCCLLDFLFSDTTVQRNGGLRKLYYSALQCNDS